MKSVQMTAVCKGKKKDRPGTVFFGRRPDHFFFFIASERGLREPSG